MATEVSMNKLGYTSQNKKLRKNTQNNETITQYSNDTSTFN